MDLHIPKVMGILNITPDSFYDGGKFREEKSILDQVRKMLEEGVDLIDVGGYSSRPGAVDVPEEEEASRVLPVIQLILKNFPNTILSIDTFRSGIARKAVGVGALMINDISGGEMDLRMFDTVATLNVPYILMHMRGSPQTMTTLMDYDDITKDLTDYFHKKVYQLHQASATC